MPPSKMVTATFFKFVLKGEKQPLKAKDVTSLNPPKYDEI
jgi:hypothetical protein